MEPKNRSVDAAAGADPEKVVLVADYGRSGQGWLSYMLCYVLNARYIEPYCLLRGIVFSGNETVLGLTNGKLPGREKTPYSMVIKTHQLPDPYLSLTDKVILLARDPRDVAVSAWSRYKVQAHTGTDVEKGAQGKKIGSGDYAARMNPVKKALRKLYYSSKTRAFLETARCWNRFYCLWGRVDICCKVTYEELSSDPKNTLRRLLDYLGVEVPERLIDEAMEKFAFENLSGRKKGAEEKGDVAFRKGIVGDHKNHFGKVYALMFRTICGKTAAEWGYPL